MEQKEQLDGLALWKSIQNAYQRRVQPSLFKIFFENDTIQYYDFYENTIFLKCLKEFFKDAFEKQLPTIYDVMKNDLDIDNIQIKPILDGNEIKEMMTKNIVVPKDNIVEKYTFESFVTGSSNKLAYAACISVAESPAFESPKSAFNPLFLYGGVGLGKTHLMNAIANRIKERNPNCKISYVSSETFTNELITAIQENKTKEFKDKYRALDVILIDDIQFIIGKERTQEEFFHTFNELYYANKQIIISSDRPPKEFHTLEDRLRSRFEMGLPTDIQAPDFETRVAILQKKCDTEDRDVPRDIINLIAKNIKSNIRELEGALNKVCAYSSLMNVPLTYDLATDILKDMMDTKEEKKLNSDYIKEIVGREFMIKYDDFASSNRAKNVAYPRQIAMYLCKEILDMPYTKIGEDFGGKDHSTVMHACKRISKDISDKKENIDMLIDKLIEEIKA